MTSRTVFRLNIWQMGQSCLFQLRWGQGRELSAQLNAPAELLEHYEDWRQLYLTYYPQLRGRELSSGGIAPSGGDLGHDLEEAKAVFLDAFQRWLGPLREIRDRIRHQVYPVAQLSLESEEVINGYQPIDVFVACNSLELQRLPWEAWEIAPEGVPVGTIRIVRIPMNGGQKSVRTESGYLSRKPRILAILGDNTDLELERDKKAVQLLRRVACVEFFDWQQQPEGVNLKAEFARLIEDERGWDALFFMGHSNETVITDGQLAIAPHAFVSIQEIKDYLTAAKQQGLQFCIFNSCCGLQIANRLADLGLQVVVMREPIQDDVAHVFLEQFCQHLAQHEDVCDAMLAACLHLQSAERFIYPSAYLIPSFFSPPGAVPFRFEPWGWKQWVRQWRPTRREAIAFSTVLLLSLMLPVQDLLVDSRTLVQAVYRDLTQQLPQGLTPPVLLIAINQDSINQASKKIPGFDSRRMNRRYLAQLINKISKFNVKTIGIDYLLHTEEPGGEQLADSIKSAVEKHNTWFVFAINEEKELKVFPQLARPEWSFQGDATFSLWDVELPKDKYCKETCPFSYLLALSHLLNQKPLEGLPQPKTLLANETGDREQESFQEKVSNVLNPEKGQNNLPLPLKPIYSLFGWRSIIDFSIPPHVAYERIPARDFLESGYPHPQLQTRIENQVVIIGSGGYVDAEDNYPVPPAVHYWWCYSQHQRKSEENRQQSEQEDCREVFSGSEARAYMVYQLLSRHRVPLIPDGWMLVIAAILGKGTTLILLQQKRQQRRKLAIWLVSGTVVYGLVGLQLYVSASVLIPWFLPSFIFVNYCLSVFRRKSYA